MYAISLVAAVSVLALISRHIQRKLAFEEIKSLGAIVTIHDSRLPFVPAIWEEYAITWSDLTANPGCTRSSSRPTPPIRLFELINKLPTIAGLDFSNTLTSDDHFAVVKKHIQHTKSINLRNTDVTDRSMELLTNSTVRHLDISGTSVTGRGVRLLAKQGSLRSVNFGCLNISDDDIADINFMTFERLGLANTATTDKSLQVISTAPNLSAIDLSYTEVTDVGLAHILKVSPNLRFVSAIGLTLTSKAVQPLLAHAGLEEINLSDTPIANDIVKNIKAGTWPNLQRLTLDGSLPLSEVRTASNRVWPNAVVNELGHFIVIER